MENNMDKSLVQLGLGLDNPPFKSGLITNIHKIRNKKIKDFSVEDLRICIGQNIALEHLIPIAISRLKTNILAEGDYYEGDLLKAVVSRNAAFWKKSKPLWDQVNKLLDQRKGFIFSSELDKDLKDSLNNAITEFSNIELSQ